MTKGVGNHRGELVLLGILGTALGLRLICVPMLEGWAMEGTHLMRIKEFSEGLMGK